MDKVRVCGDEVEGSAEEGGEGAGVFEDGHVEAVDDIEGGEEEEGVVGDVAEEVDLEVRSVHVPWKCGDCEGRTSGSTRQ